MLRRWNESMATFFFAIEKRACLLWLVNTENRPGKERKAVMPACRKSTTLWWNEQATKLHCSEPWGSVTSKWLVSRRKLTKCSSSFSCTFGLIANPKICNQHLVDANSGHTPNALERACRNGLNHPSCCCNRCCSNPTRRLPLLTGLGSMQYSPAPKLEL